MKLQDGTPQAMALLKRFQDSGNLIDVYSGKWKPASDPAREFSDEKFVELDKQFGDGYRNHLLIVCLADMDNSVIKELCEIYPAFIHNFDRINKPKFLFINLATHQILCAGLGRGCSLFVIDSESNQGVRLEGIYMPPQKEYGDKFLALDHLKVVTKLLMGLSDLDDALSEDYENPNQKRIDRAMKQINNFFPCCDEMPLHPENPY